MAMAMMVSFGVIFYRIRQEHLDVNNLLIIFAFAFGFGLIGRWIRKLCAFPRPAAGAGETYFGGKVAAGELLGHGKRDPLAAQP